MKSILSFLFLFVALVSNAQEKQAVYNNLTDQTTGRYDSYLASDGAVYKVGDIITLNTTFVSNSAVYSYVSIHGEFQTMAPATLKGNKVKIIKIRVEGNKRVGYSAVVYTDAVDALGLYDIELERAIDAKEIICFGMTEEKALEQLRKAKEKLDLELITREEYDLLKKELSQYIK